jgi:hypothetical protein
LQDFYNIFTLFALIFIYGHCSFFSRLLNRLYGSYFTS